MGGERPETRREDARRAPFLVAWAVFATYLLAARVVGNLFPLSVFDMYQAHAPDVAARVIAIDRAGLELELDELDAFMCDADPVPLARVEDICGPEHRPLEYVARDQELYVEAHRGGEDPSAEPIAIVSRARMIATGEPAFADCVIAHCTARRREGSR